ncbi:uncharacterized protein LOC128235701 [Mya arenaria]|uniref:uncharacterized protein LOC128235701 n=1 Tax=Mya arenaria TaxID=6604 RepID=UPI0022E5665A|nr:uncharacterized protein LOC128235701 [Mya arenaria]
MLPQWIIKGVKFAVRFTVLLGYICLARNQYGTISVVGPAFVNREVTLKTRPFYPWVCEVEWNYRMEGGEQFQTMNGTHAKRYLEDGSFFLKWQTSVEYNRSEFYAGCSTNATMKTRLISLNLKEIVGQCGALVILPPVVRGADVKLGYFPSDYSLRHQLSTRRTWKKNLDNIELREGSYEEEIVSEYLYILTVFNLEKRHEGSYILFCYLDFNTDSVKLYIPEPPSYPVLGPKSADFNTTECIYFYGDSGIYCKTENGTEPVQIKLSFGQNSFVLAESKENKEEGSTPLLTVPKHLNGESSTSICEVRNAIPAPEIQILVGKDLISEIQQTDSFNGSSHTFTSTAKIRRQTFQCPSKQNKKKKTIVIYVSYTFLVKRMNQIHLAPLNGQATGMA